MTKLLSVTALDLDQWADRLESQGELPRLVRRLIDESDRARRVEFEGGEGVLLGGWDGVVDTDVGNIWVPTGTSGWELSNNKNSRTKAQGDYDKRKDDPKPLSARESTFVFVTARRWNRKSDWEEERKRDGVFANVRVLDAGSLEAWLERAPATHAWLARLIGKRPSGVIDPEQWWAEWVAGMGRPIPPGLLTAGRATTRQQVREWLDGRPGLLCIRGALAEEVLAFYIASLSTETDAGGAQWLSRTVVVEDEQAFRVLSESPTPLILIPQFPIPVGMAAAIRRHHVLLPVEPNARLAPGMLDLPRLDRDEAVKLLSPVLGEDQARAAVRASGGNVGALRRSLMQAPDTSGPEWATGEHAPSLIPAVLAGAWHEGVAGDRDAIVRMAHGTAYEKLVPQFIRWEKNADPPLRKAGDVWKLVSHEDAWQLLQPYISAPDLDALEEVAVKVLGSADPRYGLPSGERWLAQTKDKVFPYSAPLHEGLAETVALLAARSEGRGVEGGMRPQDRADRITRTILTGADWKVWATLGSVLPTLIEACPDVTLRAIEAGFEGKDPALAELFHEETGGLGSAPYVTGLLWALERAAWNPQYLTRVTVLLGRLAQLDPGGRWSNRPDHSLRGLFLGWLPQTEATLEQRLQALDVLLDRYPEVGWRLLLSLLPKTTGDSMVPHEPARWRSWGRGRVDRPTNGEYRKFVQAVGDRLLARVGNDESRWAALIDSLPSIVYEQREPVVSKLEEYAAQRGIDAPHPLWDVLRKVVRLHREFGDAGWALPKNLVDRLAAVAATLEPRNPVERSIYLFSTNAHLMDVITENWRDEQAAVGRARADAVKAIVTERPVTELIEMASKVEVPYYLGFAAGQQPLTPDAEAALVGVTMEANEWAPKMSGRGFIAGAFQRCGWPWVEELCTRLLPEMGAAKVARILAGVPFGKQTWDVARGLGAEGNAAYWAEAPIVPLDDPEELEEGVRNLLAVGRPFSAIELIGSKMDMKEGTLPVPVDLAIEVLTAGATKDAAEELGDGSMVGYRLQQVLEILEKRADVPDERVARLEWLYLPIFGPGTRQPRTLHKVLAQLPEVFADVVGIVFRPETEPKDPDKKPTPQEVQRARRGFQLLQDWSRVPGSGENGRVDGAALRAWVTEARAKCEASGHRKIGDDIIGKVLANAVADPDGTWPETPVRDIVEMVATEELEIGFFVGTRNLRGTYSKGRGEGGKQERELAAKYRGYAERLTARWPKTAAVLNRVADDYEGDAEREDARSKLEDE